MIVARILGEIDAEIQRLQIARDTIASLVTPPSDKQERKPLPKLAEAIALPEATDSSEAADSLVDPVQTFVEPTPAPRRGRPKGSRNLRPAVSRRPLREAEPTAFSRAVPAGPVFVSAAELDRRRQTVVMAAAAPAQVVAGEGTLEALVREIAARRVEAAA